MKRNRLLNSTSQTRLFKNHASSSPKRKHLLSLSGLAVVGIFLTTIVLATSEPIVDTHSKIIALPNQSNTETSATLSEEPLQLPTKNIYLQQPVTETVEAQPVLASIDKLIMNDRAQVEMIQQQQPSRTSEPAEKTTQESDTLDWQEVTVKSGDNLSVIFPKVGLSARDVYNVAQTGNAIKPLLNLKPGQKLRFGLLAEENSKPDLKQLELQLSPIEKLQLTASAKGYVAQTIVRETESRRSQATGLIESSLFEAGQKAGMNDKLIMEMAYIFGWDIDFALDIRQGDNFKVIYEESYLDGVKYRDGDILAAEFTNQGKTFRAIRYTNAEGNTHYYSPKGDSMRKTFSRTPVNFSRISSKFNPNRKHPILKTSRPHNGVDYAAPRGTPIIATGDGKVEFIGNKGGYGRVIILSHGGKYSTLYGHMSKFKPGLKRGQHVKQGQIIGYVGMSGLATGPHLHYEFRINGVHRNPLTVALPKAEPLPSKYMADFKLKSSPLLAKLDQLSLPLLATNQ